MILVNEHTAGSGEMVAGFACESTLHHEVAVRQGVTGAELLLSSTNVAHRVFGRM